MNGIVNIKDHQARRKFPRPWRLVQAGWGNSWAVVDASDHLLFCVNSDDGADFKDKIGHLDGCTVLINGGQEDTETILGELARMLGAAP